MIPDWAIRTKADRRAIEQGCYWDNEQATRIVKFTEKFFRSQFIQGQLTLRPEQSQFLQSLYGWRLKDGRRRFRFANLHVPKKSFGKTLLVSVLAFYELIASGEPSPVVVSAAASRENASQVYDEVSYAVRHSPFKRHASLVPYKKQIRFNTLNSSFASVSSDGNRQHGTNASLVVIDEGHVAPQSLYDSLRWAIAARPNGLFVVISTAGSNQNHWYYSQVYSKSRRVLNGEDDDIAHYAQVHEADAQGDPESPEQWKKANPLLGSPWADTDQFRRDCQSAKQGGIGEWLNFRRLRLNQWVRPDELAWLDVSDWDKHRAEPSEDELRLCPAALGLDLSETTDPSSVSACWHLPDGSYYFRSWAWVSEGGVAKREAENLAQYANFQAEGSMTITDGDMLDARKVREHVLELCRTYDVRQISFDPRGAYVLTHEIQEQGYLCERVPPSARYFNGPMKEFAKAYGEGRIKHDGSTWLRYCLANVRVEVNRYDEIYPVRRRSVDKIDGAVSALLAYFGILSQRNTGPTILW